MPTDEEDRIEEQAYRWVQAREDGLNEQEATDFAAWLAADPRHEPTYQSYQADWDRMNPLVETVLAQRPVPDPRVLDRRQGEGGGRSVLVRFAPYLAAAAALVIGLTWWTVRLRPSVVPATAQALVLPAPIEVRSLPDGSRIELNRGATLDVAFSATERLIHLTQGEANFTVAKDPSRPFVVDAGGVRVRAVGTVFNVKYGASAVDVVVSEGKVRVDAPPPATPSHADTPAPAASFVTAGQKVVVLLAPAPAVAAASLNQAQLDHELLWVPKLLDFDEAPVTQIADEFNRRNPVHLVIASNVLAARRLTASFRSDNVEGFVRLLESQFGVKAERLPSGEIALSQK